MGKAEVVNGKIKRPILIQKEDGSFEPFATLGKGLDPGFAKTMTEDELSTITDGMSVNFLMADNEYGRIFFYTFINDKPKALKKAPSAKALGQELIKIIAVQETRPGAWSFLFRIFATPVLHKI